MRLEGAFGQLKDHELRLHDRNSRDEEQTLLSRTINMSKKDKKGSLITSKSDSNSYILFAF